jgi:hypothetical protein
MESVLPMSADEKTEDKKVYGCMSGEAPLPRHWYGNNLHCGVK